MKELHELPAWAEMEKSRKLVEYQSKMKRIRSCDYSDKEKNILLLLTRAEYDGII